MKYVYLIVVFLLASGTHGDVFRRDLPLGPPNCVLGPTVTVGYGSVNETTCDSVYG
jgi:hypothetical protein